MTTATALRRLAHPDAIAQVVCARCDAIFILDQSTRLNRDREWVHEVCPAATEFNFDLDREAEAITWHHADLGQVTPPRSPLAAPELQLLRAVLDAVAAYGSEASAAGEAQFQSARQRIVARVEGRLSKAQDYQLPGEVTELFAEPGQAADRLLGYWVSRRRGGRVFYPGLAGLEQREAEVLWRAMDGLEEVQIAREMWPTRAGDQPAIASVYVWLSEARRKLRFQFGMEPHAIEA